MAENTGQQDLRWQPFGDCAVRCVLAEQPSVQVSLQLANLATSFRAHPLVRDVAIGLLELVCYLKPGCEVSMFLGHAQSSPGYLPEGIASSGTHHEIPVDYVGEDLGAVAEFAGLTESELVKQHSDTLYHVAMIGFLPGFPYLLGLPERLNIPRRNEPRKKVRAGAVAIAGGQAGIYPVDTPGGWHILGYCDPAVCAALQPGDTLVFKTTNEPG